MPALHSSCICSCHFKPSRGSGNAHPESVIPVLCLSTLFSGVVHAQSSVPGVSTTYYAQLKYERWHSGISYGSTQFETSSLQDAQAMEALFERALENGTICEIMGCGFEWIIIDVRIYTERVCIQPAQRWSQRVSPSRVF